MGNLLTYGQAKASRDLANVSGVCGGSDQFRDYLNQAVEALMIRGNWFATVQKIRVCVYNNCVVWPRIVGTILATNVCGRHLAQKNFWFDFLPINSGEWCGQWGLSPDFRGSPCGGNAVFENSGTTSVFANVPCNKGFYFRAYPSTKLDNGKTITVFGIDDTSGQVIRTIQGGVLQEGVVLTLATPFVSSPMPIRRVDRVVKDVTQGPLNCYFFDPANNILWDCAQYQPTEVSPSYNFSKFIGLRQNRQVCPLTSIEALVKLQFVPVASDNDLVLISNTRAIKFMIQAIRDEDSGELDQAKKAEANAFLELNYELRDKFPIEQFVSSFNPFGTASFQRVTGGFI